MLLVVSISISIAHGRRTALATAAGVSLGLLCHTVQATAGLGALLRTSAWLFSALKDVGAACLPCLGVPLLSSSRAQLDAATAAPQPLSRLFAKAAVSNIADPKTAVFYFAFLPQFGALEAARPTLTVWLLGVAFAVLTFLIEGPVAVSAAGLSAAFSARPAALTWLHRGSGLVMVAPAVRLALSRREGGWPMMPPRTAPRPCSWSAAIAGTHRARPPQEGGVIARTRLADRRDRLATQRFGTCLPSQSSASTTWCSVSAISMHRWTSMGRCWGARWCDAGRNSG